VTTINHSPPQDSNQDYEKIKFKELELKYKVRLYRQDQNYLQSLLERETSIETKIKTLQSDYLIELTIKQLQQLTKEDQ